MTLTLTLTLALALTLHLLDLGADLLILTLSQP